MRKLLMTIGAAAITVGLALPLGAYAAVYSYANGSVSPNDGKVTILCNDGGAITNLTMATTNDEETVTLTGDALAFAGGAEVKVIGNGVVSNAFTAAGALTFLGVANATWNGGSAYMEDSDVVVFKNVTIDCIVPLQGYGKRGTAKEVVGDEEFLYKAFNIVRGGGKIGFEMQLYHYASDKYYRKCIFVELSQSGSDVVGKRLATGYVIDASNGSLGEQMFEYSNGTATAKSGVTTAGTGSYKLKTLTILPSALTFAVSGTETLNAVSGSGLTVTFEGVGANAKVKASGANTMTSGGFVVKGDAQNPIEYEVAAKYALPTEIECQGTATLKFSTAGTSGDGASKDTDAIVMRPGSTLQITKQYPFHYASGMVVLDGATMSHETTGNAYLNFLTLTNGATISLSSTGTFRGGYDVDSPLWTVTGAGRSTYDGDLTLIAKDKGTGANSRKYLTIDVEDTVAGDDTDFRLAGDILLDFKQFKMTSFIKSGAGTMEIDGKLYTTNLPVQVTGGTLLLSQSGATSDVSFSLEGGTLALAAGTANSADAFALTADSTLSFGDGAVISLESLTIPDGATLTLAGNVPSRGLRVSSDPGEETLGRIVFADGRKGTVVWDSNGYVRAKGKGLIISIH
jgi:hypothetical protein